MGILLKLFNISKEEESVPDIFINFEDVVMSESESDLVTSTKEVVDKIPAILEMMKTYEGASEMIRKSIANPKDQQLQEDTWNTMQPLLGKLKEFSDFSTRINEIFPALLKALCKDEEYTVIVGNNPATIKLFSQVLDFSFRFDEMKMANPALQNDLSYYRRVLSHARSGMGDEELLIHRDEANKISMFLASPTPFFTSLTQLINQTFNSPQVPNLKTATTFFSTTIKLCRRMLDSPQLLAKLQDEQTRIFIVRFMVGLIILYDHIDEVGAFGKSSSVDIKASIKVIKETPNSDVSSSLLNALKYTCKHVNDETTPTAIKESLDG